MEEEKEEVQQLGDEIIDRSREFLKDRIQKLTWEEMQELVAGLLRAMGYRTRVSDPGPDRGRDVIASPDGLGLEDPRIHVEVKHRDGTMGVEKNSSICRWLKKSKRSLCLYRWIYQRSAL
jgi:restriction system protein